MVISTREKVDKTRNVQNKEETKRYILRGERSVRFFDKFLSETREQQQKTTF